MKNDLPLLKTDILYYKREEGKRIKLKDCDIHRNFLFSKNDFFVVKKANMFFVCASVKGDLVSLWHHKDKVEGEIFNVNDIMSLFRKEYSKNNITQEKLELFLDNPTEYEKQFPKK